MTGFATIDQQRTAARAALDSAQAAMLRDSGDPRAFAKAKRARQEAEEAIERLDWAERAERERLDREAAQAKSDKLREVQESATAAHVDAQKVAVEVASAANAMAAAVRCLQSLQETVGVAVNHETFAIRDGALARPTIEPRVRVDRDAAVLALRAAQELCILAGMSRQAADQQAAQRRL